MRRRTARSGRAARPPRGRGRPPPAGTGGDPGRSPDAWPVRPRIRRAPGPPPRARAGPPAAARWRRPGDAEPDTSRSVGSISARPPAPISNHAVSPSAPNRFFPPERTRSPDRGSPSNVSTTSTACSSVRGPARSPSFVTWPVRSTAMPSSFARPTSASVQSRTWDGPPGICVPEVSRMVWMESTASRDGRVSRAISSTWRDRAPARTRWRRRRRRAAATRAATCAWDSSPETSTHDRPAPERWARICRSNVDLPMPGSPASSATEAGTMPPPSTRSIPANPVETRRSSSGAAASVTSGGGSPSERRPGWRPAPPRWFPTGRSPGIDPTHCDTCWRHPEHARMVLDFATNGTVAAGSDIACHHADPAPILAGRAAHTRPAPRGSEGGMRHGCDLGPRHRC